RPRLRRLVLAGIRRRHQQRVARAGHEGEAGAKADGVALYGELTGDRLQAARRQAGVERRLRQHGQPPAQLPRRAGRERLPLVGAPAEDPQATVAAIAGPFEGEASHAQSEALLYERRWLLPSASRCSISTASPRVASRLTPWCGSVSRGTPTGSRGCVSPSCPAIGAQGIFISGWRALETSRYSSPPLR